MRAWIDHRFDDRARRIDRDRCARIIGDADVAPIVPGRERVDPAGLEAMMMPEMMPLDEVREWPPHMGLHRQVPGEGPRHRT